MSSPKTAPSTSRLRTPPSASTFLSNVKQIFLQSGRRVDEERAKLEKKNVALAEGFAATLPPLVSPFLETGANFVSYEDDNVVRNIFMWYANNGSELGYLYWDESGRREERESQRLAVPFILRHLHGQADSAAGGLHCG